MSIMRSADGVEGAEERIKITLDLFPQVAGTLKANLHESRSLEPPERAQLTIFYGGMTFVFDDFSADMADELMQFAVGSVNAPPSALGQDMPIARNSSLQRFLDKRKSRLAAADLA